MLEKLFNPKTLAVVGASNKPGKIGFSIMQNLLHYNVHRKLFPVNIDCPQILGLKAYPKVSDLPLKELDLVIIAIPKPFVIDVLKDCAKKKTKFAVIISAGFKEAGDLHSEQELVQIARKTKIRIVGPNTLGIFDNFNKLDCLFLSITAQKRPKLGNVSLISQSGTVGAILIEQFEKNKVGLNKFVSYGNACDVNECDLLEYLNKDKHTKIIAFYVEEIIDGKRFIKILRKQKKPIVALKAGRSKKGSQSVQSHTGNLAGDSSVYSGIFKQFNILNAENVTDLVNFSKSQNIKSIKNTTIITNGGGYGILLSDHFEQYNIPILELAEKTKSALKKVMPFGVGTKNPIDIMGDADSNRYIQAIELTKKETDTYIIVLLGQTTTITKEGVIELANYLKRLNKNIVFISTEDRYTEILENDFLVFEFPEELARAISVRVKR
ncbi:MAG: CoA-binding protein [Candidatus Diapherotrites archaeon CG08_land_8_20_14_0_20_30_16]|nr:MAG: CoA-binding protein [Candidatus Diapherotrites archaeon CG08_land_8_20_14_0_20_30_16]